MWEGTQESCRWLLALSRRSVGVLVGSALRRLALEEEEEEEEEEGEE